MRKTVILLSCFALLGCTTNPQQQENTEVLECSCPHATIVIQPFDNFSRSEVEKLVPVLQKKFEEFTAMHIEFKINNPVPLPKKSFVQNRNRYNVSYVLNFENTLIKGNEVIIGLTHKDICVNKDGQQNYGIVGFSRKLQQVCIVSDKRLANKSNFWKPILHEFIHTFYGKKHCPKDDPECIMKDAKGHGNFSVQNKLCDSCRVD